MSIFWSIKHPVMELKVHGTFNYVHGHCKLGARPLNVGYGAKCRVISANEEELIAGGVAKSEIIPIQIQKLVFGGVGTLTQWAAKEISMEWRWRWSWSHERTTIDLTEATMAKKNGESEESSGWPIVGKENGGDYRQKRVER
ncbi:hypothetical protein Ancab_015092 [Ancistrocladus abbreviatus]